MTGCYLQACSPKILTEHLFVISPDLKHNHYSVHHCHTLAAKYLTEIRYPVKTMYEWTDGCSTQFKSCHCMGDTSYSMANFSYPTIRNYFETLHANLKFKANMAVLRWQKIIQNAVGLYEFAQEQLQVPSERASLRIFLYVEQLERERPCHYFKAVRGNHSILADGQSRHLKT